MTKQILHCLLVPLLLWGCISCSKTKDKEKQSADSILGIWHTPSGSRIEFFEDNTLTTSEGNERFSGKWILLSDGRYKIDISALGMTSTEVFKADFQADGTVNISSENKGSSIWSRNDIMKQRIDEAVSNAKKLFDLMVGFDTEHSCFPCDETASGKLAGFQGLYSNDYLAQLIADGHTKSERTFYIEGVTKIKKEPDNNISNRDKILEAGECGFAYIKGMSTSSNSGRPILCAPMTGNGTKFNSKFFGGKALVLRVDGSVQLFRINENGEAVIGRGRTLFQTGNDTVWGTDGFKQSMLVFPK